MSFFNRFMGLFVWLLLLVGLLPGAASACGGFFCGATPVDQQAERILFVQEDEYTVRSIVEIQYQGDPENFAWVVPVPSVPELDTFSPQALQALDLATEPFYIPAWQCTDDLVVDTDGGPPRADSVTVDVLDRRLVGPFETATIESRDPDALVEWLRINDFRVPEQMEPFIGLYVNEGLKFLAMKLQPGRRVDSIRPISMRYFARSPAVPLRLTAIAALPEMGVKVWVLADRRYGALNVPAIQLPLERVRYDVSDRKSNHAALVARLVDEQRAPAFVTEYAQPTGPLADRVANAFVPRPPDEEALEARDTLEALLRSKPYITRLYTRVSPEEMHIDPIFGPTDGGDVSNVHELPESAIAHCSRPTGGRAGGFRRRVRIRCVRAGRPMRRDRDE